MRKYVLFFLSALISTFYTLLIVFSVNGFARDSLFEKIISCMNIISPGSFVVCVVILCAVANILLMAFLVRNKLQKETALFLSGSFVCGFIMLLAIIGKQDLADFFYDTYIDVVYQGMYYDGEDKVQQILSYIIRGVTVCFLLGGCCLFFLP